MKELTRQDIDRILAFLPIFEQPDFKPGEWIFHETTAEGVIVLPYCQYHPAVLEFIETVYDTGFIIPFNWCNWQEFYDFQQHPEAIQHADLTTLRKLMTCYVRCDRFCEGYLATVFADGHIIAMFNRLKLIASDK